MYRAMRSEFVCSLVRGMRALCGAIRQPATCPLYLVDEPVGTSMSEDAPGGPMAVTLGCLCSPFLNRNGKGTTHGEPLYYQHKQCPLHREGTRQTASDAPDGSRGRR